MQYLVQQVIDESIDKAVYQSECKQLTEVYDKEGNQIYLKGDIAKALNIDSCSRCLRIFQQQKTIKLKQQNKNGISQSRNCVYFTYEQAQIILTKTRKQVPQWMIEYFKIDNRIRYSQKQTELVQNIRLALSKYHCIEEYVVDQYRIDLYIPEIKLAIEIDENGHNHYSKDDEKERQKYICKKLKCKFYRINPDVKDFNLFYHIGNIYQLI